MQSANPSGCSSAAVAIGATTPVPAEGIGAEIWSTTVGMSMTWNGTQWLPQAIAGSEEPSFYKSSWYTYARGSYVTSDVPTLNTMYAIPYVFGRPVTIKGVSCIVATAGALSTVRATFYSPDNGNMPGALLTDIGTVSGATAGTIAWTLSSNITLPAGVIWIGVTTQGTGATSPGLAGITNVGQYLLPWSGIVSSAVVGYTTTGVTGAGGTPFTFSSYAASAPRLFLQLQ